jgi:hypothetical protein
MNSTASIIAKMSIYVFISTVITFCSLVDTIDAHQFSQVSNLDWIKIILKSLVPGMISLKAYLDNSLIDEKKLQKQEEINK